MTLSFVKKKKKNQVITNADANVPKRQYRYSGYQNAEQLLVPFDSCWQN